MKSRTIEANPALILGSVYPCRTSPSGLRSSRHVQKRRRDSVAGGKSAKGYWTVEIMGVSLKAHRLVWILFNGAIPDGYLVDHRNCNESDNRIENLQLLKSGPNSRARKYLGKNNTSGFRGIYRRKETGTWRVQLVRAGKKINGGEFASKEEAASKYNQLAIEWSERNGEPLRSLNLV